MAKGYSKELVGVTDASAVPAGKADGRVYRARQRVMRAVLDLSKTTVAKADTDTNQLGHIPRGNRFAGMRIVTDTSLGGATIAVGTPAAPALYKAAGTFTVTDTPTWFGKASAMAADPVTDTTEVIMTNGGALPVSGIIVIDLFYTGV